MTSAAIDSGSNRALRRAVLIGRCADLDNTWAAEIPDREGNVFEAYGRKTSCYSRLCPHCIKLLQSKSQKRLAAARDQYWKENEREPGKCERFVTLTGPTLQGVSLKDTNRIFNRAFQLLADTAFWSTRVDAGAKHVEFTVNERGYHTHIHLLVYGGYMERDEQQEQKSRAWRWDREQRNAARGFRVVSSLPPLGNLQNEWTRCLSQAVRESGRVLKWESDETYDGWYSCVPLKDGEVIEVQPTSAEFANVDIRLVREKGRPSTGEIGLPGAIKELTKYITKAGSWSEVSDDQLVELAEVKRWPRCFELLGAWRRKPQRNDTGSRNNDERAVLRLGLGESWEDFCRRVERENGHPDSYVIAWDEIVTRELPASVDSLYAAAGGDLASLDTDSVFRTQPNPSESPPFRKPLVFARSCSLMELAESMNFDDWLKLVSIRLTHGRRVRARLLIRQYPDAQFLCLDGSLFGSQNADMRREESEVRAA